MAEQPALSFAGLLRQLRTEARLTQEELAEAAGLSPRSISDLERGINRTAHRDTARLLAGALSLAEPVRAPFVAAARGKAAPEDVLAARQGAAPGAFTAAATRALPRDAVSFTGREGELARLMEALTPAAAGGVAPGIHAIDGMAGIGKTTLAVHAAHRLAGSFPDGQFFLPLHAHTPGQQPVKPADALASLLLTAGVPAQQIPPGLEARAGRWRDHVAGQKVLLLLDDAAGHEQVGPLLPGTADSLVLITSRRRLAALGDAAQISLGALSAPEAATLLARLAARPEMRAQDAAVGEITRLCGYLPLAIGMLASQLRNDTSLATARRQLDELYDQHLLAEPAPGRYQLHDLLREHARALVAADDQAESDEAAGRLLDYYLRTALAAGQHFTPWPSAYRRPPPGRPPAQAPPVAELDHATTWLEAERANLHAAAEYAAGHARFPHATALPVAMSGFLKARGHWDESAALYRTALAAARRAGDRLGEADTLAELGIVQRETGDYRAATASLGQALGLYGDAGDLPGQANILNQLGFLHVLTGDYPAAMASQRQALTLARSAGDGLAEGAALNHLGLMQHLTGDYPGAAASQRQALTLSRDLGNLYGQAYALNDLGIVQLETGDQAAAAASLLQALTLFRDLGNLFGQAQALNDLGIVQQEAGDYPAAAASHQQALRLFTDLGNQLGQAEALNRLGELAARTADTARAREHHARALAIARDLAAAPEEARALEGLGHSHLRDGHPGQAAAHLRQALTIYQRIGAPTARRVQQTIEDHELECS